MAGVSTEKGSGDKLNFDLNLVPFIDLLSSLVLFLLLSVVWVRIAAIQASVDSKGRATLSVAEDTKLNVRAKQNSYQLKWPSGFGNMPSSVAKLDDLAPALQNLQKSGRQMPPAVVAGDDDVEYGVVAKALDTLKSQGIKLVTLSTD